jgi:hypothetical protein
MIAMDILRRSYYHLKPVIPRRVQLMLRRRVAHCLKKRCERWWPICEEAGSSPPGWNGWPDSKRFALVLTHDVESRAGHDCSLRLAEIEEDLGFRSAFNFVPERYQVSLDCVRALQRKGFEVGVHGLCHDGRYFVSREVFEARARRINHYLMAWGATGYRSPSMLRNLDWFHLLNIDYDCSTFDTDPFEPQPEGVKTIFPFWVDGAPGKGYVEIPYTLPQDFTLFVILGEKDISIWKKKLAWIAMKGGMALLNVHPDYLHFDGDRSSREGFPLAHYTGFLDHVRSTYSGDYWHALPREVASLWAHRGTTAGCGPSSPTTSRSGERKG